MEVDPNNDRAGNGGPPQPQTLSAEGLSKFEEGVGLLFSRWTALQMAVQNEWGGRSSAQKAQQLQADIVAWLAHSNVPRYIDELEEMLDENMLLSFNTETEDGSLEEVAENLMLLHEECLQGNYDTVYNLQMSQSTVQSVSQSQQILSQNSEDESPGEEDGPELEMEIDSESKQEVTDKVESSTTKITKEEIEDGWCVVPSRRKKGQA
uniref:TSA: Wollemia nobilis Ref_Wollemi_Transcript_4460_1009 transcribed RNA sequence n=1 Tax=Wollemia nobilis TaxID=56998 RepID=A0A0C9S8H4_9CONI